MFYSVANLNKCRRYPDFRAPPNSDTPYEPTSMYWHVQAGRLAFVVIFENVVATVIIIVKWCIPDIPRDLRDRIRREVYITNEIILKQETIRAQNGYLCMFNLSVLTFQNFKRAVFL